MVSDRIVKSQFFVKFHRSGPAIIFSFLIIMEHVSYPFKKAPNEAIDLIKMVSVTPEGLWMVSYRIVDFRFSSNFTGPDQQKFSFFEISLSTLVIYHKST